MFGEALLAGVGFDAVKGALPVRRVSGVSEGGTVGFAGPSTRSRHNHAYRQYRRHAADRAPMQAAARKRWRARPIELLHSLWRIFACHLL